MSSDQSSGKTWQLSLYEKHRKPQDIIISNDEIAVSPRSLHSELMCPICLDMLKNTMTTKECLHRFCQDCIITALRNGNKECPTCRKKLISKRSLRPDPNFDELISKIYPSRDEYEAQQERVLAKISKQNLGNFDDSNCDTENNKKKLNFENDGDETETEQFMSETSNQNTEQDIEVIFIPLNINNKKLDSNLMETRYIKTTINATIDHLVKYLSMRYILDCKNGNTQTNDDLMKHVNDEASLFTIYQAGGPGEFKPLNGQKSLKQIATDIYDGLEKYKKINKPLELHYAYKMPTV